MKVKRYFPLFSETLTIPIWEGSLLQISAQFDQKRSRDGLLIFLIPPTKKGSKFHIFYVLPKLWQFQSGHNENS